jgi:hypothetical protein
MNRFRQGKIVSLDIEAKQYAEGQDHIQGVRTIPEIMEDAFYAGAYSMWNMFSISASNINLLRDTIAEIEKIIFSNEKVAEIMNKQMPNNPIAAEYLTRNHVLDEVKSIVDRLIKQSEKEIQMIPDDLLVNYEDTND